jgi:hypothetical protein
MPGDDTPEAGHGEPAGHRDHQDHRHRGDQGREGDARIAQPLVQLVDLIREWDAAGTSSSLGRRTFLCLCGRRRASGPAAGRQAVVTQAQLNAAYRQAVDKGRRRISLEDLRRATR